MGCSICKYIYEIVSAASTQIKTSHSYHQMAHTRRTDMVASDEAMSLRFGLMRITGRPFAASTISSNSGRIENPTIFWGTATERQRERKNAAAIFFFRQGPFSVKCRLLRPHLRRDEDERVVGRASVGHFLVAFGGSNRAKPHVVGHDAIVLFAKALLPVHALEHGRHAVQAQGHPNKNAAAHGPLHADSHAAAAARQPRRELAHLKGAHVEEYTEIIRF